MGERRKSRELALQALFFLDSGIYSPDTALNLFCNNFESSEPVREFFNVLVSGVLKYKDEIDELISRNSKHWRLSRMSGVDSNILRIAIF